MIKFTTKKQLHLVVRDFILTYLCESCISVDKPVEPDTSSFSVSNLGFQLIEAADLRVLVSDWKF